MAYLNDAALDAGLAYAITNGTQLSLCSAEPATYAGIAAVELAKDTTVTMGAAANGSPSGRAISIPATACVASAGGTATHWALHNGTSTLVATGAMAPPLAVTNGFTYNLGTVALITLIDATAA